MPVTFLNGITCEIEAGGDNYLHPGRRAIMKAGETVFNIISSGYGMNFKASQELLKAANGKDDLGKFKVGEILLIPVQGYVANTTAGVS